MASTSSPNSAWRIDATISLVVVLPLEPVTAITGISNCARQAAAKRPSASSVSATTTADAPAGNLASSETNNALAPLVKAGARKSWASKFSPRKAIKSWPAAIARVSVDTPTSETSLPSRRPSTTCATFERSQFTQPPPYLFADAAPMQLLPVQNQRTAGVHPRSPDRFHGLFQQAG